MTYYMTQRAQACATAAAERKKRREMARAAAAMATPPCIPPLAVKRIGRYEKIEAISSGTYGIVYCAHDYHTGEVVAMKCLNAYDDFDAARLDSIIADEVGALEPCRGLPCVVQLLDSCRRDLATSEAFIVMELGGPSLKDATTRGCRGGGVRRHAEGEVRRITRQLLVGAAAIHGVGLMHRDIKPDNILVGAGGSLKIYDLGKAHAVADDPPYSNPIVARNYRALELLLRCADYDAGVDTWAIGCIMAELLAGSLLFDSRHSIKEHHSEVLNVLGTDDIKEWSCCPECLPSGSGPTSFLRDLYSSSHDLAMAIGQPALSEVGFEVLCGLLRCNPEKRMTAACALKHRWFDEDYGQRARLHKAA